MTGARASAFAAAMWLAGIAAATVRMDPLGGTWRDDFTDLSGLAANQQGAHAAPSGYTIDSAIQSWTQPYSTTGFSESFSASGIVAGPSGLIGNPGSTAEFLTLWQTRFDPGAPLLYCKTCASPPPSVAPTCPVTTPPTPAAFQNGMASLFAISNVPYMGTTPVPAVGWAAIPDAYPLGFGPLKAVCPACDIKGSDTNSIQMCAGSPLLYGDGTNALVPGQGYTASFVVAAQIGAYAVCTTEYLSFAITDLNGVLPSVTASLFENDFADNLSVTASFTSMLPVSLELPAAQSVAGALWDFNVSSAVTQPALLGHPHPTVLGPIWVTAHKSTSLSRVFDSLSDQTQWVDVSWVVDQATTFIDSSKSPIPLGSPLCPVQISYAVSNTASARLPVTFTVTHGGEATAGVIGMNMVQNGSNPIHDVKGAPVSGRYFQWSVTLFGRGAAGELDADLAPSPAPIYFGGYLPSLRRIAVRYYVCAARAQSRRIAPSSVKRWRSAEYAVEKPTPGGIVRVDVLGSDGGVLLANIPSGASLEGIDPFRHPSLSLRAVLESDPADCNQRPILTTWQVRWEPLVDVIEVACNSLRPHLGEQCQMEVRVERPGPVRVEVHDASGQVVKILLDAELPAEARMLSWDGRNGRGEVVAAGVYFVVARVPGARRVRRLAVIR